VSGLGCVLLGELTDSRPAQPELGANALVAPARAAKVTGSLAEIIRDPSWCPEALAPRGFGLQRGRRALSDNVALPLCLSRRLGLSAGLGPTKWSTIVVTPQTLSVASGSFALTSQQILNLLKGAKGPWPSSGQIRACLYSAGNCSDGARRRTPTLHGSQTAQFCRHSPDGRLGRRSAAYDALLWLRAEGYPAWTPGGSALMAEDRPREKIQYITYGVCVFLSHQRVSARCSGVHRASQGGQGGQGSGNQPGSRSRADRPVAILSR
jgi:hypothetical protein